jgi:hypothetical protein
MKRDMELVRLQLMRVEGEQPAPDLSPYTEDQKVYHMALCIEAGLVDGVVVPNETGYPAATSAVRLTCKCRCSLLTPNRHRRPANVRPAYRNSSAARPLPSIMLLRVPMGIGLLPCLATMTCRPLAWRHFWWLPRWLTHAKPCVRRTRTTSLALQTGKR